MSQDIEERFLKDIQNHSVQIIKDDGLYRHLRCSNGGSQIYRFDIITWPGFLTICQDMGTYVFSRLPDMFEFFRSEKLDINANYWGEKCQASCTRSNLKEFSEDKLVDALKYHFDEWEFESDEQKEEIWEEIESQVISHSDGSETRAMDAATEFKSSRGHMFSDFWEHDLKEYTLHYIWCLYGIVWAIQQYDAATLSTVEKAKAEASKG